MAEGMAAGGLVGARRVQKVAGERALLRSIHVAAIVQGERFPARSRIRAPADVRHGAGLAVAPGSEIFAHQLRVQPGAFDRGDVISVDRQPESGPEITLARRGELS